MTTPLTHAQIDQRRTELATVEEQLRALSRRRTHLRREILTGYALPSPVEGKQLSLPAVEEAVPEPVVIKPAAPPAPAEDFDTTLFRPSKRPGYLLPTLTSKGKGRVLALLREAPVGRMPVEEIRRRLRLPIVPLPSGCSYQSGDWVLKEIPKKSAAKVAPSKTKAPPKKLRAPRPTKTIREAKPKILDSYPPETWAEGFHSVAGLIDAAGRTRGAWLLLHAKPNATVAAEVLDLLEQAGLVVPGETIQLGAVPQADLDAQPDTRLSYLLTRRVGEWICELVASSPKPPTVDALARLTGLHRGLFCALLNALEEEGRVRRSKGSRIPVWVVSAQDRTAALFEGVEPAPAREEAAE